MNEEKFRKYLSSVTTQVNTAFDNKTIDDIIDVLKNRIPNKLGINRSLLDINDIKYCQEIKKRLSINGDLYEFNRAYRSGRPSQSIYRYIDFLERMFNDNINVTNHQKLKVKNIVLYGSPGVGKTHNTNKLISLLESGKPKQEIFKAIKENKKETIVLDDDIKSRTKFVTFHQSFGYEDFIEGFRPNEEGKIELVDGVFKIISNDAKGILKITDNFVVNNKVYSERSTYIIESITSDLINIKKSGSSTIIPIPKNLVIELLGYIQNSQLTLDDIKYRNLNNIKVTFDKYMYGYNSILYALCKNVIEEEKISEEKNYYLVIDEINRGNISKIFGELITLIEEDKRDKLEVTLPYSKQPFKIPSNLYIIGTMNSSDKSIALIDIALRRRFTFLKMEPNADLIEKSAEAKALFIALNEHIRNSHLGEDYQIGHSYFMGIESDEDLDFVWEYKIKPLLEEYFYGDKEGLDEVLKLK